MILCAPINFYFVSHLALVYLAQCFTSYTPFINTKLSLSVRIWVVKGGKTHDLHRKPLQSAQNHAFKTCFQQASKYCIFFPNYREQGGEALHCVKWHTHFVHLTF